MRKTHILFGFITFCHLSILATLYSQLTII